VRRKETVVREMPHQENNGRSRAEMTLKETPEEAKSIKISGTQYCSPAHVAFHGPVSECCIVAMVLFLPASTFIPQNDLCLLSRSLLQCGCFGTQV
jgi:hypothetical protein